MREEYGARGAAADSAVRLRVAATAGDPAARIMGLTAEIQRVREQVRKIAEYRDVSVLVLGETGTGKELVAQAIHELGEASGDAALVGINCAALPETLVESELFGHEAGAFTGTRGTRCGLFETAGTGTVFLDEVAEMQLGLQSKLLRVLETRRYRRVGSNCDLPLEARVVSATNRSLRRLRRSSLRPDLYYRLAGFTIELPALRDRLDDVPILARNFLDAFVRRHARPPLELCGAALEVLESHSWPGNVRELRGVVEQAAILARGSVIEEHDVREALRSRPPMSSSSLPPPTPPVESQPRAFEPPTGLRDAEREMIVRTFRDCGGNVSMTARRLGVARSTVRGKLRRYGVE